MKILLNILCFLPMVIYFVMTVRFYLDYRRHRQVMRLFDQAEIVDRQFLAAVTRGDDNSARFHYERYVELYEMIKRETGRK